MTLFQVVGGEMDTNDIYSQYPNVWYLIVWDRTLYTV